MFKRDTILRWVVRHSYLYRMFQPLKQPVRHLLDRLHYYQMRKKTAQTTLKQIQKASTPCAPSDVVAVMVVRNEMAHLPLTITHHRSIGIKRFAVIDNNSNDGTLAWLQKQPDIDVFWTDESYADAYCGLSWTNAILATLPIHSWTLVIDADEQFYYQGMETMKIGDLTSKLNALNMTFLYTPMIDLFGFQLPASENPDGLIDGWHDVDSYFYRDTKTLGGQRVLSGGVKYRLMKASGHDADLSSRLTKYALVKRVPGRLFTASTHEFMPKAQERHTIHGHLLHLKFGSEYFSRHGNPDVESEHYLGGSERAELTQAYQLALEQNSLYDGAVRYRMPESLDWFYKNDD